MKNSITLIALAGLASAATADLTVTELFTGLSGEDGTADWIEVTNTGTGTIDTGDFFYDDDSADILDAGQLDSILLGAGQSAIFLEDDEPSDEVAFTTSIAEFQSIWNYSGPIGLTNGGGGLSNSNNDAATILDAGGSIVNQASYSGGLAGGLATIDFSSGSAATSVLGVNGAFASETFFNDNLGLPNNEATLVGSPGVVPAPGAAALLALGGLVGARRRR